MNDGDEQQRLAVTLGLLLLVGGVLILRELAGPVTAFVIGAGVVLAVTAAPPLVHALAVWRLRQRLRHW